MVKELYDLVIIGGGASGLFLANLLHDKCKIALIEAKDRVGRKILASGNGKCNLLNQKIDPSKYNNPKFIKSVTERITVDEIINKFLHLGLLCKNIDGRIYPYSENANTVLNILRKNLNNVDVYTDTKITDIKKDNIFTLTTDGGKEIHSKTIVLATGSNASGGIDSTDLYVKLGHSKVDFQPALTYIKTDKEKIKGLSGIRVKVTLSITNQHETGEILFKDDGVSGIVAFNMASKIQRSNSTQLYIDFMPDYQLFEVRNLIKEVGLDGIFHSRIVMNLERYAQSVGIVEAIKKYRLDIVGYGQFNTAQVATGGINLSEFNEHLESNIVSGTYATGEVLDIDGECGGYNLYWAWASAMIVAQSILTKSNTV